MLLGIGAVGTYNALVRKDVAVSEKWGQVQNVLQRRADLIPNLVQSVKGYAAHEKEIFENVAAARAKLAGARTPDDAIRANAEVTSALSRLLVVVENYPQLKSDANFRDLSAKLVEVEDHLQYARRFYNGAVKQYVTRLQTFPDLIVAKLFAFRPASFFETEDRGAVEVRL